MPPQLTSRPARLFTFMFAGWTAAASAHLVRGEEPKPATFLSPGFVAEELPLRLKNLNNLRYRPDGRLFALGYNGTIHLLSDTDGDGIEDRADVFWDRPGSLRGPIGMAVTPPGAAYGSGVFVASKGKVSLIVDRDGDDRADEEVVVASGWQELPVSVDAVGCAIDPSDGSIFFGLGTPDFSNAYLIDPATGRAGYTTSGVHGTVQRIAPDLKSRETVCTGVRFTTGLAFNGEGDLFATDQEGATWLPNGNPYDELLHIQAGRHYGFPPRHPAHLPDVIDEPSVFDYGPQHQCTVGLAFNIPVNGGPTFGPSFWRGDVFVAGESRGRLYRTRLVKTPAGYVARNHILACLSFMPVDVTLTPRGDLLVCGHSGDPDWGTGPEGEGRIIRISFADPSAPQPVVAWQESPTQFRVAFDRHVDAAFVDRAKAEGITLAAGRHVREGDLFEHFRPGYAVINIQKSAPVHEIAVADARVASDRASIILATREPFVEAANFALRLGSEIEIGFRNSGVLVSGAGGELPAGAPRVLPHVGVRVARSLVEGTSAFDAVFAGLERGGATATVRFDLRDMLRPEVQAGGSIDHEWPAETTRVTFPPAGDGDGEVIAEGTGVILAEAVPMRDAAPVWSTNEDPRQRAFPIHRLLPPWVETGEQRDTWTTVAEIKGGDWAKGREHFFGTTALCSQCHRIRGEGARIGPDLSNLPHRDHASVLRDIRNPNAAINHDYISHRITMDDGSMVIGVPRADGPNHFVVGVGAGAETRVERGRIRSMEPLEVSLMPAGLDAGLGEDGLRDLLCFLLTEPPRLGVYHPDIAPPAPRSIDEIEAVLAGAPPPPSSPRPLRLVLVAGPKDHGVGEHDYPRWQQVWRTLLGLAEAVEVDTAWIWPSPEQLQSADCLVFFRKGDWSLARAADLDKFLARGGGATFIHWAVEAGTEAADLARRIGLASNAAVTRYRHGPLDLSFAEGTGHPIARNLPPLHLVDESYWDLVTGRTEDDSMRVLATAREEGSDRPLFWTVEHRDGGGRVFVSIPGHYSWSFDDPIFRAVLLRGIAWTAGEPVDRFNNLVRAGVEQ